MLIEFPDITFGFLNESWFSWKLFTTTWGRFWYSLCRCCSFFSWDMASSRIKIFPWNVMPLSLSNSLWRWSWDNTNAIRLFPIFPVSRHSDTAIFFQIVISKPSDSFKFFIFRSVFRFPTNIWLVFRVWLGRCFHIGYIILCSNPHQATPTHTDPWKGHTHSHQPTPTHKKVTTTLTNPHQPMKSSHQPTPTHKKLTPTHKMFTSTHINP